MNHFEIEFKKEIDENIRTDCTYSGDNIKMLSGKTMNHLESRRIKRPRAVESKRK